MVSICSVRECAIPCLLSPAPWGAPCTSPTVAEAPPVAVLWHSYRLPSSPARPPGCCPSSGRRCGWLVLIPLGGISPTSALPRPHRPTTIAPSAGDASAAPMDSRLTPLLLVCHTFALSSVPLGLGGALPHTARAAHPIARPWCYPPTSPGAHCPPPLVADPDHQTHAAPSLLVRVLAGHPRPCLPPGLWWPTCPTGAVASVFLLAGGVPLPRLLSSSQSL